MILTVKRLFELFDAFGAYPDELRVCRKRKKDMLIFNCLEMENFAYNNGDREVDDIKIDFADGIMAFKITLVDAL